MVLSSHEMSTTNHLTWGNHAHAGFRHADAVESTHHTLNIAIAGVHRHVVGGDVALFASWRLLFERTELVLALILLFFA